MKFKHSVHIYIKRERGYFWYTISKSCFVLLEHIFGSNIISKNIFFITYRLDIHNGKISIKNELIPQIVEILVCCVKNTAFIYCTSELLFMIFRAFFH